MGQRTIRPAADEHDAYYGRYIRLVPAGDIVATLARAFEETGALLASVRARDEVHRYAPGKWSVREVVGHLLDTERTFALRALWVARAAAGEQPSYDQDDWAAGSNAGGRSLLDLTEEWRALRRSNVLMFDGFAEGMWLLRGRVSGREVSTRALVWIIAGHELHHRAALVRDYLGRSA